MFRRKEFILAVPIILAVAVVSLAFALDMLAMSALLTVSAPEQKKVIDTLEREGLRGQVKVMMGGPP